MQSISEAVDRSLLPCVTCLWRVDQQVSAIPRYNHEKACGLMNTVGPGDGFRPIMACHGSTEENMRACKGYLAREGWSNLNVRILLMKNQIENPSSVLTACDSAGVRLHRDYPAVLKKLSKPTTAAAIGRRRK